MIKRNTSKWIFCPLDSGSCSHVFCSRTLKQIRKAKGSYQGRYLIAKRIYTVNTKDEIPISSYTTHTHTYIDGYMPLSVVGMYVKRKDDHAYGVHSIVESREKLTSNDYSGKFAVYRIIEVH